jgi:hypothetical protein
VEDLEGTGQLAEAGRILGIVLLDRVVWTRDGGFHAEWLRRQPQGPRRGPHALE